MLFQFRKYIIWFFILIFVMSVLNMLKPQVGRYTLDIEGNEYIVFDTKYADVQSCVMDETSGQRLLVCSKIKRTQAE